TVSGNVDIYALTLHDALPISLRGRSGAGPGLRDPGAGPVPRQRHAAAQPGRDRLSRHPTAYPVDGGAEPAPGVQVLLGAPPRTRSEEHTSELQSRENLVCRLR